MRRLTDMNDRSHAHGLSNLLLEHGIESRILEESSSSSIWIMDDEHLPKAKMLYLEFQKNPQSSHILNIPHEMEKPRNRVIDVRTEVWNQSEETNRTLTIMTILICAFLFLGKDGLIPPWFLAKLYIADPIYKTPLFDNIMSGEVWRLITPIFMHGSMMHLIFNMIWLFQLGSLIETREGTGKLLRIMMVSGTLSNCLQYVVGGPLFLGMSGVIYGLLSYAWGMGKWQPSSGYFIDKGTFGLMMVWLVLCFTGIFGPVANYAHLGGFIVGLAWSKIPNQKLTL